MGFLFVFAALNGCGKKDLPDGMPSLVKFTLTITQDGKPLEGASVMLQGGDHAFAATGLTNSSGVVADIKTAGEYDGVPEGNYQVRVQKIVETPSQFGNNIPGDDKEKAKWFADRKTEYRPTHSYVNAKYGDFSTTDLTVTVSAGGSQTLDVGTAVDDITIPDDSAPEPPK